MESKKIPIRDTRYKLPFCGERLAEARKKKGITQENMALLLSVSQGSLTNWERGETRPLTSNVEAMAEILGVPNFAPRSTEIIVPWSPDQIA